MQSEFITTARAKGMSETALLLKHAVRIAILPVVSLFRADARRSFYGLIRY